MTHYLLSLYQPAGATPPSPEALGQIMADVNRLNDEIKAADSWVFGGGLDYPSTATVLRGSRSPDGEVLVTDGPFAEGKEYLAGFSVVRAGDLDTVLAWGRRLTTVTGLPVEVRPFADEV